MSDGLSVLISDLKEQEALDLVKKQLEEGTQTLWIFLAAPGRG